MSTRKMAILPNWFSQHCHPIRSTSMTKQKEINSSYENIRNTVNTHKMYIKLTSGHTLHTQSHRFSLSQSAWSKMPLHIFCSFPPSLSPSLSPSLPPYLLPFFLFSLSAFLSSWCLWNTVLWQNFVYGCFRMKYRERPKCCRKMIYFWAMTK